MNLFKHLEATTLAQVLAATCQAENSGFGCIELSVKLGVLVHDSVRNSKSQIGIDRTSSVGLGPYMRFRWMPCKESVWFETTQK